MSTYTQILYQIIFSTKERKRVLIKDTKLASSKVIKKEKIFPGFCKWQIGYGAFTYSIHEKDKVIEYVKNQVKHHKTEPFIDEYKRLLKEFKIEFDEKYLL